MSLQANQPKIAGGMWLLNSPSDEELKVGRLKVEG
jgi:hypothetical protein